MVAIQATRAISHCMNRAVALPSKKCMILRCMSTANAVPTEAPQASHAVDQDVVVAASTTDFATSFKSFDHVALVDHDAMERLPDFVLPLYRMEFNYCSHLKNSRTLMEYLSKNLANFASQHPNIEFVVQPKFSKHPTVTGYYTHGRKQTVEVSNLPPSEIHKYVIALRDKSGVPEKEAFREKTISRSPAVRPPWDPWHHMLLSPFDGSMQAWKDSVTQLRKLRAENSKALKKELMEPYRSTTHRS